jgi:hypothetical protein
VNRRRTVFFAPSTPGLIAVDHAKVCDGFAELACTKFYRDREATCGICGADFRLSAQAQKDILEGNGVPLKMLDRGAAFCGPCLDRRRRINSLNRWRSELVKSCNAADRTAGSLVRAASARADLFESFGEGDLPKGLRFLSEGLQRSPQSSELATVRARLVALNKRPRSSSIFPAREELQRLRDEERIAQRAASHGGERDTIYPCDSNQPVRCPKCRAPSKRPG